MEPAFQISQTDLSKPADEVFELGDILGEGAFGGVYSATHKSSGNVLAVKKVPLGSALKDLVKEIVIMRQCNSVNIVNYYGSYYLKKELWIVMENCGAGSVNDLIHKLRDLDEDLISALLHGTLSGLIYLHGLDKIHRDLKSGNILLTHNGVVKLADFGVSGQLTSTLRKRNSCVGTPYWMSPEIIQQVGYNTSTDIWSLGITAIEMADRFPPLADVFPMRAMFLIPINDAPTLRQPQAWSTRFNDFIRRCVDKDPSERAYARELIDHPFILDHSNSPAVIVAAIHKADYQNSESDGENGNVVLCDDTLTPDSSHHSSSNHDTVCSSVNLRHSARIDQSVLATTSRKYGRSESVNQEYMTCSDVLTEVQPFQNATAPGVLREAPIHHIHKLAPGIATKPHFRPSFDLRQRDSTQEENDYDCETMIIHDSTDSESASENYSDGTMRRYDTACDTMICHDDQSTMIRHNSDVFHTSINGNSPPSPRKRFGNPKFVDLSDTMANYNSISLRNPDSKRIESANATLADLKTELAKVEEQQTDAINGVRRKFKLQRDIILHEINVRKNAERH